MPTIKTVLFTVEHRTWIPATEGTPQVNCRFHAHVRNDGTLTWDIGWLFCPWCGERLPMTLEEAQFAS